MRTTNRRVAAALAIVPMALSLVAAEGDPEPIALTETLFISAGCPQDTPGTCTSTRWLGKQSGDSTSNFITAVTPADEVLYRAEGSINWRDYPSDLTFSEDGYLLDTSRDLEIDLTLSAGGGAMINETVHARAILNVCDVDELGAMVGCTSKTITAEDQTLLAVAADTATVEFDIDLPDTLAGKTLRRMTVEVAVHGLNVQGGHIDQQGGSPVRIPYLLVPEAPAA